MPTVRELRRLSREAVRAKLGNKSAKQLKTEAKEKAAAKRSGKKRYGTRSQYTTEGIEIQFGYADEFNVFHPMDAADYVKEYKAVSGGKVPIHEKLLDAKGISDEDRQVIADALKIKRDYLEKVRAMRDKLEPVSENGIPARKAPAKPKPVTSGKKK